MESSSIDYLIEESKRKDPAFFTDREEPRNVFWKHFDDRSQYLYSRAKGKEETAKSSNAILYYGVGGIGKTFLLDKIKKELAKKGGKKYRFKKYDFDRIVNPFCTREDCIRKLCKQLSDSYDFKFLLTELAFMKIASESGEDYRRKKETVNQMINDSRVLKPLVIGLKLIPCGVGELIGIILSAYDAAETLVNKPFLDIVKQKNNRYKAYIQYIRNADVDEIQANIHTFFSYDLEINLRDAENPLVIMLDTYEQYMYVVEGGGRGSASTIDDWLKNPKTGLIHWTPSVLWVICGRDKFISEASYASSSSWSAIELDEHLLGNLSGQDTKCYLQKVGMTNLKLIERLYEITMGVPIFLNFCFGIFKDNANNPEKQNSIETYGQTPERIIDRYLQGMSENMLDLIKSLSCLNYWTDDLVSYLRPEISGFSDTTYMNLLTLSLVNKVEDRYYMHTVVRNLIFKTKTITALATRIRSKAALYFKHKLEEEADDLKKSNYLASYLIYSLSQCNDASQALSIFNEIAGLLNLLLTQWHLEEISQVLDLFNDFRKHCKELDIRIKTITSEMMFKSGKFREAYEILSSMPGLLTDFTEATPEYFLDPIFIYGKLLFMFEPTKKETFQFWENLELFYKMKCGPKHLNTIGAQRFIAILYSTIGDYQKSLELFQQCHASYLEMTDGEENEESIAILYHIAQLYEHLGDFDKAVEYNTKCHELMSRIQGNDNPSSLLVLIKLADSYIKKGDNQSAKAFKVEAYESMKKVLGETHYYTIFALSNLAVSYAESGDTQKVLELYDKFDVFTKKAMVEMPPEYVLTSTNPTDEHIIRGDGQKVLDISINSNVLELDILGNANQLGLVSMVFFAEAFYDLKNFPKAIELYENAYESAKRIFGDNATTTIEILTNLAHSYNYLGDKQKALPIYQNNYEFWKNKFGKNHPFTYKGLWFLAQIYSDLDDTQKAMQIYDELYGILREVQNDEDPDKQDILNDIAKAYFNFDDFQKALQIFEELYELQKKVPSDNLYDSLDTLDNIAVVNSQLGNIQKAVDIHEMVYKHRKNIQGEKHPDTLWTLDKLADEYYRLGDKHKALELSEKCYEMSRKIQGDDYPDTLEYLSLIQKIQQEIHQT